MSKYFVSGIGTAVGKTIASAILTEAFQADYWKPVQTGSLIDSDTQTVRALISNDKSIFHPETYSFRSPVSPHKAAAIEGKEININNICLPDSDSIIVEGAGGIMVPLNEKYTYLDLFNRMDIPLVLVIRHYLGAINHSLLSIEVLKRKKIRIAGLIFNGLDELDNEHIIEKMSGLPILGRIEEEQVWTKEIILKYAVRFKKNFSE